MKEGSEGDVGSDDVLTSRDADSTVSNGGNKRHLLSPALGITALALPSPEGGPLGGTTLANALLGITLGSNGDGIHSTNGAKMGLMVHHRGKSNGDSGGQDGNRSKQFTCGICTRSFGYKHVLQNHERTHTGEKPFECKECHKRFTRDHHLKTHMRLHTGEKPYHCNHCDRQFVQVANLRRHLRVHTGERPYACTLCSSRFSDSNQLKAHILIHKGEKPFFCEKCSGRFRRRHHLVHHKCPMDEANAGKPRRGRRPKAYDPPPTLLPALLTAPVQPPPQQQQATPSAVSVIQQPPAAHMHQHMQRRPLPPPSALHLHLNGGYHHPVQSGPLDMTMSGNGGGQVSVIVQPPRPSLPVYPEGALDLSNSRSDSEAEPIEEEVDEELGMDSEDEDDSETELLLKHHQGVIACSWFDGLRKRVTSGKGMAAKGKTAI